MREPKDETEMTEQSVVHTPGPWVAYDDWYIKKEDGRGSLATVSLPFAPQIAHDECRANARLIAAAPELLEACVAFLAAYKTCDGDMRTAALMAASAVDKVA